MSTSAGSTPSRLSLVSRDRLETLVQLSQAFNSTIDSGPLLRRILELTITATEAEAGALWVLEHDTLRCTDAVGPAASRLRDQTIPLDDPSAAAEAIRNRASVVVPDALNDNRYALYRNEGAAVRSAPSGPESRAEGRAFRTRSALSIPLLAVGEPLGVIELVNDVGGKDVFGAEDIAFLELVADDAAAALRNARLFEAERRAHNLKALLAVSQEITSTFDLTRLLFSIVNLAGRAIRFDRCVIAVREGEQLQVRAISGEPDVDRKAPGVYGAENLLLWAAERREVVAVPDTEAGDDDVAREIHRLFDDYLKATHARALLVVPITDAEGELGMLLFEFGTPNVLDDWTREASELLANQAALSIRNAQLYGDVPFISWLEPLAQKRRALMALPGKTWMRYAGAAAFLFVLLFVVRLPLRVRAEGAEVHAALQRPARAGVAGTLAEVLVREGDVVEAGQLVAIVRNDALRVRVSDTEGELRLAEREGLALEASGDPSGAAGARLRATQLRASLALLRHEAEQMRVLAPSTGIVLTPRLEERIGSYREAGEPILWIGARDSAEVRLRIAQHDVVEVRPSDRVRVRVAARPDVRFDGNVAAIAPLAEVVGAQSYYTVRAVLANPDGLLRPGMSARARVLGRSRPLGSMILRRPWRFIRMHLWW